ncbi:interleukin-4 receptor subunit alpha [Triplophysa rosa]|uniref:Interleukin-3 receptor class 2 subunit beta-like n=1 Tax=Triplophysa rosa TaxID=992332 RepID=A0A9W7W9E1_TRIRA|nr:interleukin-4 receptor subunit alpha [Triplophysa rosa]KAI7792362.1 putative interleukin-3 receptor class 2 subunit beta-like [Triplophysa rosa]
MHRILFFITAVCVSDIFITLGDQYRLECLNDYISTVSCSLNISEFPGNVSAYRLKFSSIDEHENCTLTVREQSLVCVLDFSPVIFSDVDSYSIFLGSRYHDNSISVLLDGDYEPKEHVRPLAPCNLSLIWNKDGAVVQWQSGYNPKRLIIKHLQYQLSIDSRHAEIYLVTVRDHKVFVEECRFKPHTNYTVRVRTQPNQGHYKGVWSEWSPPLYWSSGNIHQVAQESSFHMITYLLLVPVSLVLLLCISYSRCRKQEYVPSPAPYFRDWDRDVQIHSLLSGKMRDVMQGDEALHIDIVTENDDTPPKQMTDEHESTPPQSPVGSEVDSGCWIRDVMATERGSITCSEDYCTLSHSLHTYAV